MEKKRARETSQRSGNRALMESVAQHFLYHAMENTVANKIAARDARHTTGRLCRKTVQDTTAILYSGWLDCLVINRTSYSMEMKWAAINLLT